MYILGGGVELDGEKQEKRLRHLMMALYGNLKQEEISTDFPKGSILGPHGWKWSHEDFFKFFFRRCPVWPNATTGQWVLIKISFRRSIDLRTPDDIPQTQPPYPFI